MASTAYGSTSFHQPTAQRCIDPSEMENWIDFNSMPSPGTSMSRKPSHLPSGIASPASTIVPLDVADEHQTPVVPSHDYSRYRQTTGVPANSLANMPTISESSQFGAMGFSNSGFDDFSFGNFDGMGSNSGLPMGDFTLDDMAAYTYADESINPAAITKQEEAPVNVRFYPGMHQQQAMMAKAQAEAQAQQQRQQQQMLYAQQKQRQASRASLDPRTEETIARVVNQIRQNSMAHSQDGFNGDSLLPHVARAKKDEEDMDEDERLLNSEEGKKLSSKERRQLRNKVSARAFRSRRKEYIGQLEGELATKVTEAAELQMQNRALMEENSRFRSLAEKLLRHPAFHPFLEDLSRDPELAASLSKVATSSMAPQRIPAPQVETQHIGMALMPEPQLDFSSLNLGNNNWGVPTMGMATYQQPSVFAVHEISMPEPVELPSFESKGESVLDRFTEEKFTLPEIESKMDRVEVSEVAETAAEVVTCDFDEDDELATLFASSKPAASNITIDLPLSLQPKPHFQLVTVDETTLQTTDAQLARLIARMERVSSSIDALTRGY